MKNMMRILRISAIPLAGASLIACAPFFDNELWQPNPGVHAVQAELRPSIGYYENAVAAINARHYALALEYLQAARTQSPDDVRVLTAFGVVYDKLGRFDLSARYYGQAAARDPRSSIIAADIDYSRRLQGLTTAAPAPMVAQGGPNRPEGSWPRAVADLQGARVQDVSVTPAAPPKTFASIGRKENATGLKPLPIAKTGAPPATRTVFLTGHPLMIVDASGRNDVDKPVKALLSGLGWTVAKGDSAKAPARLQTTIIYQEAMGTAAKALARTLLLPMRLTASNDIQGLQLVLGNDISDIDFAGKMQQSQHRKFALAVTNTKTQE